MRRLEYLFMALVFVTAGAIIAFSYFQGPSLRSVSAIEASTLGVFWDPVLLDPAESIDWGLLRPGEATNVTLYLVNETPSPVSLSMNTGVEPRLGIRVHGPRVEPRRDAHGSRGHPGERPCPSQYHLTSLTSRLSVSPSSSPPKGSSR